MNYIGLTRQFLIATRVYRCLDGTASECLSEKCVFQ